MIRLNTDVHPSLSEMVTENLRRRNVITIIDFVSADPIKLASFTSFTYTDILQIKQHILKKFGGVKKNVIELLVKECNDIIPTKINSLDKLLKGGLYQGQLCEVCGSSSSGKTQLCLTIAANVASQSDIVVWYFDTKNDFSKMRYEEIVKARNSTQEIIENVLCNTKICQTHSSQELIQALRQLRIFYKQKQNDVSYADKKTFLVIIDSLPAVIFKVARNAQQSDLETTHELDDLAHVCQLLTSECNAIVLTVNLVTQWISPEQKHSTNMTSALGKYWAQIPTTRLFIARQYDETRKINVWKDSRLTKNSFCTVNINHVGVTS
ncbi:hypothetical protein PUN28_004614 [Cardiocondyla obscurior]|uniref:RecA family profile 1 domain-containing protein n=1 Tax=Cardiocondyla obscurior TaxID=286306 RepID=A0AAW2GGR3_9HYME